MVVDGFVKVQIGWHSPIFLIEPNFDLPLVSSFFNTGSSFILDDLIDADIQDIGYAIIDELFGLSPVFLYIFQ
jgi:hypothetical protein